jgi:hypothetical protein
MLSILRTELGETLIPNQEAADAEKSASFETRVGAG